MQVRYLHSVSVSSPVGILVISTSISIIVAGALSFSYGAMLTRTVSVYLLLSHRAQRVAGSQYSDEFSGSTAILLGVTKFFAVGRVNLTSLM